MAERFSLQSKVVMVTGASSGLGEHFAKVVASAGADVVIGARRVDRLEALAAELREQGTKVAAVAMDVTNLETVRQAFDQAEEALGRTVDVLVNNAGVADPKFCLKVSEDDWDFLMDTNLKGAWFVAREAAARMSDAKTGGSIINIASILGLRVGSSQSHYAVAKAGVVQMTKAMGLELARNNVRINALAPGYFKTEMNDDFFSPEKGREYLKKIPQRRLGELHELDGPLLLLASDASAFMTGAVIPVDGGHLINAL